jgi:hypothetical protein
MIAVTGCARRAPSIVVAGSGGELLQTALGRLVRSIAVLLRTASSNA